MLMSVILPLGIGLPLAYANHRKAQRAKARVGAQLAEASETDLLLELNDTADSSGGGGGMLRQAFDTFDVDKGGELDQAELRSLLRIMYPSLPREKRKPMLQLASNSERVSFDDFDDAVVAWRTSCPSHALHRSQTAACTPAVQACCARIQACQAAMPQQKVERPITTCGGQEKSVQEKSYPPASYPPSYPPTPAQAPA